MPHACTIGMLQQVFLLVHISNCSFNGQYIRYHYYLCNQNIIIIFNFRPWLGDKLPVAEITKRTEIHPPFRV